MSVKIGGDGSLAVADRVVATMTSTGIKATDQASDNAGYPTLSQVNALILAAVAAVANINNYRWYSAVNRTLGANYQNNTGKLMVVYATVTCSNGSGNMPVVRGYVDGFEVSFGRLGDWNGSNYAGGYAQVLLFVPPGSSYAVSTADANSPTVGVWNEFR